MEYRFQLCGGEENQSKSLPNCLPAIGVGLLAGVAFIGWQIVAAFWKLTFWGRLRWLASGATPGLSSTVLINAFVLSLLTAAIAYAVANLLHKKNQALYYHLPRYLNAPFDPVAASVAYLLLTPALHASRVAALDTAADQAFLEERLSQEWGYHPQAARQLVQNFAQAIRSDFDWAGYLQLYASLTEICPEIHRSHLQDYIRSFLRELPSGAGRTASATILQAVLHL